MSDIERWCSACGSKHVVRDPHWHCGSCGSRDLSMSETITIPQPTCSTCKNEIDPNCCWCGEPYRDARGNYVSHEGHVFTPAGCTCGIARENAFKMFEVPVFETSDMLLEAAWKARDAALSRQRVLFDAKYGDFLKCSRCGAAVGHSMCWCPHPPTWARASYTRRPT